MCLRFHCQHRCASHDDAAAQLTTLARELRERRALLGLSQVALSKASGVSRTVINKIEAGARVPSVRTYARLREALGLQAPAAALIPQRLPRRLEERHLIALCAAIVVTQTATLADLASALDLSIPAIRENLDAVAERLRPVGFWLTDDGGTVRLWPLPGTPTDVVRTLTAVEEEADPSAEQLEILTIVAFFGQADRSLIERCRAGEDSASMLDRMTRAVCSPRSAPIAASAVPTSIGSPPRHCTPRDSRRWRRCGQRCQQVDATQLTLLTSQPSSRLRNWARALHRDHGHPRSVDRHLRAAAQRQLWPTIVLHRRGKW